MEYRRKLREKWGNEKGVREIERYVLDALRLMVLTEQHVSRLLLTHPHPIALCQATTSTVEHQERCRAQEDHVGCPEDQGRQSETTYSGGAHQAYGREEE